MSRHNRHFAVAFAISGILTLSACAGPAGDVSVLQGSDISALHPGATYAWPALNQQEKQVNDPRIDNDIIRERIRMAVDNTMAAKGYRKVSDPSSAQILVMYHIGLQNRTDYRVDSPAAAAPVACGWRGCISGFGWGMYGAPTDVRSVDYTEGTLMLDLVDQKSNRLAWRATSQQQVDSGDATQERLNAVLADMTKTLPGAAPAS